MVRNLVLACGLAAGVAGLIGAAFTVQVDGRPAVVKPERILAGVSSADARLILDFYEAMADVVVRDGRSASPVCKTVFDLRNRHAFALAMAFEKTGMEGKYVGLGQRLDRYLLDAVGDVDVPLTPELRASAAKAFAAIK